MFICVLLCFFCPSPMRESAHPRPPEWQREVRASDCLVGAVLEEEARWQPLPGALCHRSAVGVVWQRSVNVFRCLYVAAPVPPHTCWQRGRRAGREARRQVDARGGQESMPPAMLCPDRYKYCRDRFVPRIGSML
eukprot:GHVU01192117.1.p2 GENE.GHVU01192117.1~~GHVU01192117.1.p2  ORF type:complete len:135 (-),score=0.03 GHVU01192117.1:145-549(-)